MLVAPRRSGNILIGTLAAQLYSSREFAKADFAGVLKRVADIGHEAGTSEVSAGGLCSLERYPACTLYTKDNRSIGGVGRLHRGTGALAKHVLASMLAFNKASKLKEKIRFRQA